MPLRDSGRELHPSTSKARRVVPRLCAMPHVLSEVIPRLPFGVMVWQCERFRVGGSFRLIHMNAAASTVVSGPPDRYLGKTLDEAFPNTSKTDTPKLMLRVVREGCAQLLGEFGCGNGDARRRDFVAYAFPLPDRCVGLALERVNGARHADKPLAQMGKLLELCWDSVIATDFRDRITYWNRGAERTYGWPRQEAIGRRPFDLFMAEGDIPLKEIRRTSLQEGYWKGELQHTRKDGRRIVVDSQWIVQRDRAGKPSGWLQVNTDISARKHAEFALNREREFSMRLIESSLDSISAFDLSYRYTLWNRSMEKLTGIARADAIGRPVFEVLPFLKEIGEASYLQAALTGKSVSSIDRPFWIASTNRRGFFEARYTPIRADAGRAEGNGRVIGGLAVMRDITERRKSEESLRILSARLLQIQDDERRRIARDLHDGTTQTLMGIKLNLGSLRRLGLDGKAVAILDETIAMADRAVREVRTTCYLLHPPELDLIGLAGAVRSYARGFSDRTGIRCEVEISQALGRLPQEVETALFRIVQESLTNVHRHSKSGSAIIRLVRDADCVVEEIQDFGRGMPSPGAAARPDASLGVGIAGMRTRVRQLGGEMRVDSGMQGTLVRVTVPVSPGSLEPEETKIL